MEELVFRERLARAQPGLLEVDVNLVSFFFFFFLSFLNLDLSSVLVTYFFFFLAQLNTCQNGGVLDNVPLRTGLLGYYSDLTAVFVPFAFIVFA